MIEYIRKILRNLLGVSDIYHIQGSLPILVEGHLLNKGNTVDIIIDVEPIASGSIVQIDKCKYSVIGCALRIVKYDT